VRRGEAPRVCRRPPSLALRRACGQRLIPIVSVLCFSRRHVAERAEQPTMVIPMDPSSVASSTAFRSGHERLWITFALDKPLMVSANALSYESPTLPARVRRFLV